MISIIEAASDLQISFNEEEENKTKHEIHFQQQFGTKKQSLRTNSIYFSSCFCSCNLTKRSEIYGLFTTKKEEFETLFRLQVKRTTEFPGKNENFGLYLQMESCEREKRKKGLPSQGTTSTFCHFSVSHY